LTVKNVCGPSSRDEHFLAFDSVTAFQDGQIVGPECLGLFLGEQIERGFRPGFFLGDAE